MFLQKWNSGARVDVQGPFEPSWACAWWSDLIPAFSVCVDVVLRSLILYDFCCTKIVSMHLKSPVQQTQWLVIFYSHFKQKKHSTNVRESQWRNHNLLRKLKNLVKRWSKHSCVTDVPNMWCNRLKKKTAWRETATFSSTIRWEKQNHQTGAII